MTIKTLPMIGKVRNWFWPESDEREMTQMASSSSAHAPWTPMVTRYMSERSEAATLTEGPSYDALFERIAVQQTSDMNGRVTLSCSHLSCERERLSAGIRLYVQRAHDEPHWGHMMMTLGFRAGSVRSLLSSAVALELEEGQQSGSLEFDAQQPHSATAFVCGAVVGAVSLVLNSDTGWELAGSNAAEFVLRGLGASKADAKRISTAPLPALVSAPHRAP